MNINKSLRVIFVECFRDINWYIEWTGCAKGF